MQSIGKWGGKINLLSKIPTYFLPTDYYFDQVVDVVKGCSFLEIDYIRLKQRDLQYKDF